MQLLDERHAALVAPLGKQSGRGVDKAQLCALEGQAWATSPDLETGLIPGCSMYLRLRVISWHVGGAGCENAAGGVGASVELMFCPVVGS
jgi:hypothetical protein